MIQFQVNDPSIESQWRAIILFGMNSATYKFAFAKSLLELADKETNSISLTDLATPFSYHICEHLQASDKQGNASSSKFLDACRNFNSGEINQDQLINLTIRHGFNNVVDAFHHVGGSSIHDPFYSKDYKPGKKHLVITDHLLKLKESHQFHNLTQEVEARWSLVETAWNFNLNKNLLEVQLDHATELLFLESDNMRRVDITGARESLNGYQKGRCFYSNKEISVNSFDDHLCDVDHFLPHINKKYHQEHGGNINGVWNLVLADSSTNREKNTKIPDIQYLYKLHHRNEFYIESKHPLAETIMNQTGHSESQRKAFLQKHYDLAKNYQIQTWSPKEGYEGNLNERF